MTTKRRQVAVRLTEKEHDSITAAANKYGLPRERFIREAALAAAAAVGNIVMGKNREEHGRWQRYDKKGIRQKKRSQAQKVSQLKREFNDEPDNKALKRRLREEQNVLRLITAAEQKLDKGMRLTGPQSREIEEFRLFERGGKDG
jgi:hypothetical protein